MARGRKQSVPEPSHKEMQPPDRQAVDSARTAPHPAPHAVLRQGPANRRLGAVARSAPCSHRLRNARAAARLTPEAETGPHRKGRLSPCISAPSAQGSFPVSDVL